MNFEMDKRIKNQRYQKSYLQKTFAIDKNIYKKGRISEVLFV